MRPNEKMYEKIQQYLDQSLSAEERTAFEQEMQSNDVLAEEVKLNQEMKEMLGNSSENQLLGHLEKLSREKAFQVKKTNNNWKYWLFLLPILVILSGLWYGTRDSITSQTEQEEVVDKSQEEIIDATESIAPEKEEIIPGKPTEEEKVVPPTKPAPSQKKTPPKETTSEPIAMADFSPNPSLDFLIANNMRDASLVLEVQEKQPNRKLSANKTIPFELVASLTTEEDIDNKDFKLHLFSNKKEDFDNFEPLSTFDLNWQSTSANKYSIDFQETINIPAGLYYYLIEDFNTEKIYYVEKFEVRMK